MQEMLSKITLLQSVKTAENSRKPQSGFPDVVPLHRGLEQSSTSN